jgi:hypothetical protein
MKDLSSETTKERKRKGKKEEKRDGEGTKWYKNKRVIFLIF